MAEVPVSLEAPEVVPPADPPPARVETTSKDGNPPKFVGASGVIGKFTG